MSMARVGAGHFTGAGANDTMTAGARIGTGTAGFHHGEILQRACVHSGSLTPCLVTMPARGIGSTLYLLESLTDVHGERAVLAGILPGHARMHARLQGLGHQSAPLPGGMVRGHTFHHSTIETPLVPIAHGERAHGTSPVEAIFGHRRLIATYFHGCFPSNPVAAAELFRP